MSLSSRPVQPVPPESMELVFFYRCPGKQYGKTCNLG